METRTVTEIDVAVDTQSLLAMKMPRGLPFKLQKLGHVVLLVKDLQRSTEFYTQILGFRISDAYGPDMGQGGDTRRGFSGQGLPEGPGY
jgi:catechol-2,3-dioxygenase